MNISEMINATTLVLKRESLVFLTSLPEVQEYEYLITRIEDIGVILHLNANTEPRGRLLNKFLDRRANTERLEYLFGKTVDITLEDVLRRYHYEKAADISDIDTFMEIDRYGLVGIDYNRLCSLNRGRHEQFITALIDNGYLQDNESDFVTTYCQYVVGQEPFVANINDIIEFKLVCDRHPEWGVGEGDLIVAFEQISTEIEQGIFTAVHLHMLLDANYFIDDLLYEFITACHQTENDDLMFDRLADMTRYSSRGHHNDLAALSYLNVTHYLNNKLNAGKLEECLSRLYASRHNPNSYIDEFCVVWKENTELLIEIKKLIAKHPEWHIGSTIDDDVEYPVVYISPSSISSIKELKYLVEVGIVDSDHLNDMIDDVLNAMKIDDDTFKRLDMFRTITEQHPSWVVNYTYNNLDNMQLVEYLMTEGFWTHDILQAHIDAADDSVLRDVFRLTDSHPEWGKFTADVTDARLAFELGADRTTINGQPPVDAVVMTRAMRFFNSKT